MKTDLQLERGVEWMAAIETAPPRGGIVSAAAEDRWIVRPARRAEATTSRWHAAELNAGPLIVRIVS